MKIVRILSRLPRRVRWRVKRWRHRHPNFSRRLSHVALALVLVIINLFSLNFLFQPKEKVQALTSGPRTATSSGDCVNDTGIGDIAWTSTGNAISDNGSYAQVAGLDFTGFNANYLKCTNFGFSIPTTGVIIDGIVVAVERKTSSTGNCADRDYAMRIVKGGTIGSTDKSTTTDYTVSDVSENHGGSTDLWGETWTASDINASTFGAAFAAQKPCSAGGPHTVTVDVITITVHYTLITVYDQSSYRWFENQDMQGSADGTFLQTAGGTSNESGYSVALDSYGNIYTAGYTESTGLTSGSTDVLLQKYSPTGIEQWSKSWGGADNAEYATAIALDSSGNIYITGAVSSSAFTAGSNDFFIQKYDSSGAEQWTKTWGGSGADTSYDIAVDSSGNIYVTGETSSSGFTAGGIDFVLQKYNSSGVEQWTKTWGGTGTDSANGLALDASGNIYVAGYTGSSGITAGSGDVVLQQYNSSGVEQWTKTWGGTASEAAYSVAVDSSSNAYIVGYTASSGFTAGSDDILLQKYNSSGVEQWTKTWGGTSADWGMSIALDSSGNIFTTGMTASSGFTAGGNDIVLQKFNSSGAEQWTTTWGSTEGEAPEEVIVTGSAIYVAGYTGSTAYILGTGLDYVFARYDTSGAIANCAACVSQSTSETDRTATEVNYSTSETDRSTSETDRTTSETDRSPQIFVHCGSVMKFGHTWGGSSTDTYNAVTTDTSGNIYAAGQTSSSGFTAGGVDAFLQKFNSSGVEQWTKTWGDTGTELLTSIAVDTSGNIYIVGNSTSAAFSSGSTDWYLQKLNSSGVEQWTKTWGGSGAESLSNVIVDSSGNIFVAGSTSTTGFTAGTNDFAIQKFDSSGAEQWTKTWGDTGVEFINDMVLDTDGNIVVVGQSTSSAFSVGSYDLVVQKYNSSGAEQWTRTWGGTSSDHADAVAVDTEGNIFMAGITASSGFTSGGDDIILQKYNSSGVEQWTKTWGSSSTEVVNGLSMDSSGNLYVAGSTNSTGFTQGTSDMLLQKYNSSGAEQWTKTWGGTSTESANAIAIDTSDNIYLAGAFSSTGYTAGGSDGALVKTRTSTTYCNGVCTERTTSETDRTTSETERTTSETDRSTSETDRTTSETDRTTSEVVRFETLAPTAIDVGSPLNSVAQNTATTAPNEGTAFRLRITMHITSVDAAVASDIFKLQYAQKSGTCDTSFSGEVFTDVSTSTSIAYYNNTNAAESNQLAGNSNDPVHSSHTNIYQQYNESGNFGVTNTIAIGSDGLWDIALIDNGAPASTSYCFRIVTSAGSQLGAYTVVPEITTGAAIFNQSGYRWFENNENPTYFQTIGGTSSDSGQTATTDSSGNVYVGSFANSSGFTAGSDDFLIQKFNSNGVEQWTKSWGGSSSDYIAAIQVDSSGNVYTAGTTISPGFTSAGNDYIIQKFDSSGVEQWTKSWGGTGNDFLQNMTLDSSGNVYVTGYTPSTEFSAGSNDLVLQKYNSSGVEQWTKTWGDTGAETGRGIEVDSSGNIYVAGSTSSAAFSNGNNDFVLQKYNSSGVEQWTKTWGDTSDEVLVNVDVDTTGNVFVGGYTSDTSITAGDYDVVIQKYDSSGSEQWTKTWGGTSYELAQDFSLDATGNLYVTGYTASTGFTAGGNDMFVQKYNSSGTEQWTTTWGGTSSDYGYEVDADTTGNVYVVGTTASSGFTLGTSNIFLAKFNSSGTIANCTDCVSRSTSEVNQTETETDRATSETDRSTSETDRSTSETDRSPLMRVHYGAADEFGYSSGGTGIEVATDIVSDTAGNLYLAGYATSSGFSSGSYDIILQKYNSSGVEQWTKSWGGSTIDLPTGLAIDSSGNLYVSGQTDSSGFTSGGTDFVLQKYNSSGVEQWTKTWGGSGSDISTDVTLDSSGNIYVVGQTASTGFTAGSDDIIIQKYDSSGVEQWTKTWGGTSTDMGSAIVVDSSNNIYVAGRSNSTGFTSGSYDFVLQKYDSSGAEQWTKTWGDTGAEHTTDLALDSSGNIFVTGYTDSTGFTAGSNDYVLQKYNSSGVEQWTKTWGGTSSDVANALVVDSSGNIYVAGNAQSTNFSVGSSDQVLQKYNSSGVEQWTKTFGGASAENIASIIYSSNGSIYTAGDVSSSGFTAGNNEMFLSKVSSDSTTCGGVCTERSTSETDRTTSETDRSTSETDRATSETDRSTSETDRTTSEVRRFESMPISSFVGTAGAALNTSLTLSQADMPVRLYLALHATAKAANESSLSLKLQYSVKSGTCDTSFNGESYTDVSTSSPLSYYAAGNFTDGSRISIRSGDLTHSSHAVLGQAFIESASITNPNATAVGNDYVWDLSLTPNEALNGRYCLRFVYNNGSLLTSYSYIPELYISAPSSRQQLRHGKFFDASGGTRQAFYW